MNSPSIGQETSSGFLYSVTALLLVSGIIVILDQATKYIVVSTLSLHEARPVIPGFFNLIHIRNTGAAFGILAGAEKWRHIFFQVVSVLALCGIVYLYKKSSHKTASLFWGSSLVFGGALGNLMGRISIGSVIDFLDVYIGQHHWPAFNVADSAITVGGLILAYYFLKSAPSN